MLKNHLWFKINFGHLILTLRNNKQLNVSGQNNDIKQFRTKRRQIFLAYQTRFSAIFTVLTNLISHTLIRTVGKIKTKNNTYCQYIGCIGGHVTLLLRVDVIATSHKTSVFNMADVNIKERDSFMVIPMLELEKYARKRIYYDCSVRTENSVPRDHCFGISWQNLVMPNSDPRTDFAVRTSHPWTILIVFQVVKCVVSVSDWRIASEMLFWAIS